MKEAVVRKEGNDLERSQVTTNPGLCNDLPPKEKKRNGSSYTPPYLFHSPSLACLLAKFG